MEYNHNHHFQWVMIQTFGLGFGLFLVSWKEEVEVYIPVFFPCASIATRDDPQLEPGKFHPGHVTGGCGLRGLRAGRAEGGVVQRNEGVSKYGRFLSRFVFLLLKEKPLVCVYIDIKGLWLFVLWNCVDKGWFYSKMLGISSPSNQIWMVVLLVVGTRQIHECRLIEIPLRKSIFLNWNDLPSSSCDLWRVSYGCWNMLKFHYMSFVEVSHCWRTSAYTKPPFVARVQGRITFHWYSYDGYLNK